MSENNTPKILQKPVHVAILKPTLVTKLQKEGKFPKGKFTQQQPEPNTLPEEKKSKTGLVKFEPLKQLKEVSQNTHKQAVLKAKLKVLHESVPPLPEELNPHCENCKAAPCCYAFAVNITEDEYNSGLYEPFAVKLTEDILEQIQGKVLLPSTYNAPIHGHNTEYYLEGRLGEPCPFLTENNRCGIYEHRPLTCRVYSCVGDERITQAMRDGVDPPDIMK